MESNELEWFAVDVSKNSVVQSNYIASSIIAAYVMFTKVIGPSFMKNRKPFDLKLLILIYNMALIVLNVFAAYVMTKISINNWPYRCDFRNSPIYTEVESTSKVGWFLAFIKYTELFDTVLFILRKKFNQVSFLHVFHHAVVCLMVWLGLKYYLIGYYSLMVLTINCSIHILLYLYYALSALGPEVRKYLWWKQYLTTMQIMQFFVLVSYMTISFLTGCEDLDYFGQFVLYSILAFTVLFFNFYYRTYAKKKAETKSC